MMPGHANEIPHHATRMRTAIGIQAFVRWWTNGAIRSELKTSPVGGTVFEQERAGLEADVAATPAEVKTEVRENGEEESESGSDSKEFDEPVSEGHTGH